MNTTLAIIPAAGRGQRLDQINQPKPLVPVGGVPLIVRTLRQLEAVGITRAVVVVGHRADEIIRKIAAYPGLNVQVEFVRADWERGLAASLLAARSVVNENFVLVMGDHLFDESLIRRIAQSPPEYLSVLVDLRKNITADFESAVRVRCEHGKVTAIGHGLPNFDGIDAGLFHANPMLFDALEKALEITEGGVDLSHAIAWHAQQFPVRAIEADAEWHDIDTPSDLVHAEMWLRASRRAAQVGQNDVKVGAPAEPAAIFHTGKSTATEVIIGRGYVTEPHALAFIPDECASSPIYVITDETVNGLYGEAFVGNLVKQGYDIRHIVTADGEESKSLQNYTRVVERILGEGIDERSVIVSLGGGVVCNLAGFIASTLYRGINLIHFPTTLMAQCDAAISHKQGLNGSRGKNLVGAYYAPRRIIVDIDALKTLEGWRIPDGLSEVVKHALGQDASYFEYLANYDGPIDSPDLLEYVVRKNVELKCQIMAVDPQEKREGMVLQYGHTMGHPIEFLSGYELSHGQAVGIGMNVAGHVSHLMGGCSADVLEAHQMIIQKYGLPIHVPSHIKIDQILDAARFNKRYLVEGTRMALLSGIGELWQVADEFVIPVPDEVIREALHLAGAGK